MFKWQTGTIRTLATLWWALSASARELHHGTLMVRPWSLVALLLCLAPTASAADRAPAPSQNVGELRPRAGSFSLAALFGYNYGDEIGVDGDRLLFGYGVRAGYSFETSPLYLGVTVVGYKAEVEYDDTTETGTERYIDTDIEIGAELDAGPWILRPYVGCGARLAIFEGPSGGNSAIVPHLAPGLLVRYPLGPVDLGVDARLELYTGWPTTVSALGHVGVAF